MDFDLRSHTILLVVAGSRAFGVHNAHSDVDVKGVAIPPPAYFHGFAHVFEQATEAVAIEPFTADLTPHEQEIVRAIPLDGTVFDVRKFLRLAADANPNLLDVLFCRDDEVRRITPLGLRLREARGLFLSARARHTFAGYATAQLKRIETHRRWLLDPPEGPPSRAEYDLPERTVMPADQLTAAWAAIKAQVDAWDVDLSALPEPDREELRGRIATSLAQMGVAQDDRWQAGARTIGIDENFLLLLDRERRYKAAKTQWEQYRTWRQTRNAARAEGEARYGYDVKHGAHLYRLLKMCREILLTGEVHVWRGDRDADEILAIRRGEWPYERLVAWAKEQDTDLGEIYARKGFVVPEEPDRAAIDRLCVDLVESALGCHSR